MVEDMQFDEFLALGLESVKDDAKGYFSKCRIGKPIVGRDEDYYDN